ncbi:hypothetical protein LXA43DRAFT_135833 [Ganoderma leucocontextum]|nr:hypothetical protein LXA43DRAFT_135833 [Ganoderma leucocontextum]
MDGSHIFHTRLTAPLIHVLPIELLSEIFTIVACIARQTVAPTAWMQLLLVCKLWKRIASDIAELWRVIYVNSNQDWLRLCLARAPRCFIDLHLVNVSVGDIHAAKHLILPHKDRIRALRIKDSHDRLMNNVADMFTVSLPALEELSFVPVEWRVKRETSFALSAQAFPWIRSLTLSGVSIPRELAFYRNLRYLELHEHCCKDNGFTIRDLFDALQTASATLEDLDLSRFDPIVEESRPLERPQVHLQNLRSFCMDNSFELASQLVKHLRITPCTHLRLRIAISEGQALEHRTTERLLAAIVPPGIRVALDQAEDFAVLIGGGRFRVRVFDRTPSSSSPQPGDVRSERVCIELLGPCILAEALRAVPRICAAPLTTLSITAPNVPYDVHDWRIALGAFPLLENLAIQGWQGSWTGSIGIAFTALAREAELELPGATSKGAARCPSLKAVRVEGRSFGDLLEREESRRFLSIVVRCLRSREGYARKLDTLTLRSFLQNEAYVELEGLVDKVEIAF